ncbi:hypothetical protein [Streptacidiphilus sp. PAMC 29251]
MEKNRDKVLEIMDPLPEEVSVIEARTLLGRMINAAQADNRVTYITRKGKRAAAVVPLEFAGGATARTDDSASIDIT